MYAVNGNANSYIEAEAELAQGAVRSCTTADASRSGGDYIDITEGSGNHTTVPDEGKVMWYDVNVSTAVTSSSGRW